MTATRSAELRGLILDAGERVLSLSDTRPSMDDVAAEAGVARRTVFNHFATKEALFEEILLRSAERQLPRLTLADSGDCRADLLGFALRYAEAITGEGVVALYRMIANAGPGAAAKLAGLQNDNYILLRDRLAAYFTDHMGTGEMRAFHARFAAERFLTSVVGMARVRVSLGLIPDSADRAAYIADTIDQFLAAVRPG